MEDWRITFQDEYLSNRTFIYTTINTSDHEHCEFCFEKIYKNSLQKAYCTLDGSFMVCKECYQDFKHKFSFNDFNLESFVDTRFSDVLKKEVTSLTEEKNIYRFQYIKNVLNNIRINNFSMEHIFIIPCIVTLRVSKPPMIERLVNCTKRIKVLKSDALKEVLEEFSLLSRLANKDLNQRLYLEIFEDMETK